MDEWVSGPEVLAKSGMTEDELVFQLMEGCAAGHIAAQAANAFLYRKDSEYRESNWPVPEDAWRCPTTRRIPALGVRGNPLLSLNEGVLVGSGFNRSLIGDTHFGVVELGSVSFRLEGLSFQAAELADYLDCDAFRPATNASVARSELSDRVVLSKQTLAGAKPRSLDWELFAAGLAVLIERGEFDASSENKAHESVATFLMSRGHERGLQIDSVRTLIRRVQAWRNNHPFPGDADYDKRPD